ncbi:hypothetical protein [Kribbella deserti]|uniref:DUF222 domain-containing protein n=1 Tax=Kribbella deserti TaxID=1926257 RepID=A0ABV6QCY6_9ACTN
MVLRDEFAVIRDGIARGQAEIDRLVVQHIDRHISKADCDKRMVEPSARLEALRTRRRELHHQPPGTLAGDELDALIADLIECRTDAIKRKKLSQGLAWSGDRPERQQRLQAVADEIDWYTVRLEEIGKLGTSIDPVMVWADCRYYAHRIARLDEERGVWMHCDVFGMPLSYWGGRGCRAASFDRDGDWNDALPRTRTAAPVKSTVTSTVPLLLNRPLLDPA